MTESLVTFGELESRIQAMGLKVQAQPGDRILVIAESLSYKIFINQVFKAEVNGLFAVKGPIAELFAEARGAFGDFLADAQINEGGQTEFSFHPRHIPSGPVDGTEG